MSLKDEFAAVSSRVGELADQVGGEILAAYADGCAKIVDASGCDGDEDDIDAPQMPQLELEPPDVAHRMATDPDWGRAIPGDITTVVTPPPAEHASPTKEFLSHAASTITAAAEALKDAFDKFATNKALLGVDMDKVNEIATDLLAKSQGATDAERIDAAFTKLMEMREADPTNKEYAAVDHMLYARRITLEHGVAGAGAMAVGGPAYELSKVVAGLFRSKDGRTLLDSNERPATPASGGSVAAEFVGIMQGLRPEDNPLPPPEPQLAPNKLR